MKIAFDAKRIVANFTGLGNYSRFVVHNLIKYYPQNTYKLFAPKLPSDAELKVAFPTEMYVVKEGFKPLWRTLGIVNDIRKEKPDIYHGLSNELPVGIQKTGVKSIVTIHDLIFLKYPQYYPPIDRFIYNLKARYACQKADRIVAISECTKRDIIEYYNIDPSKIDIVYQGCNEIFKETATDVQKQEVRDKYQLPSKFILSIGSIEDRKNILLIAKALKQVPDVHFVAIGKQREYAEKVKQYVNDNGLANRVHLLSNIPLADLPTILQLSSIFIYPSLYEGFGIPIIEALNCGVPVIAATGSCLEEAGGTHSVYVNPHDENELAAEINRLLSDSESCASMVAEGRKYVTRFSDEACTNAMIEVYNKLLEE